MDPRVIEPGERHALRLFYKYSHDHQPVVFDVGANVGDYTNEVLKLFPEARMYCFEPQTEALNLLWRVIRKRYPKALLCDENLALGSQRNQNVTMRRDVAASYLASFHRKVERYQQIPLTEEFNVNIETIDNYCHRNGILHINWMKVDVEGNELEVLNGANKLISNSLIDCIQFEHSDECSEEAGYTFTHIYQYLVDRDYRVYLEEAKNLLPVDDPEQYDKLDHWSNFLAVSSKCQWWQNSV